MRLRRLDLGGRGLEEFPQYPRPLEIRHVEVLSLYNNRLRALPDSIWRLTELRVLNVSVNQIEEISGEIANLCELRMLDLAHNKIAHVPEEIGELRNLSDALYLS